MREARERGKAKEGEENTNGSERASERASEEAREQGRKEARKQGSEGSKAGGICKKLRTLFILHFLLEVPGTIATSHS